MTVPFTNVSGSTSITASEFSLPANTTTAVPTSQTTAFKKGFLILDRVGSTIAGDQFNAVIYEKVAGGTQRPIATFALIGATTELDVFELPALGEGWDITLKRISSTNRTIGWSIREDVADVSTAQWAGQTVHFTNAGYPEVDLKYVRGAQVNALSSGRVDAIVSETSTLQTTANGIKAKTDNLPTAPADETLIIAATNALAAAIAALPSAAQNAIAVLASTVDGTDTLAQAIAIILAQAAGNATIDESTGTYSFKGKDNVTVRLAGTIIGTARTVTTRNGA
jgi:hypothetical protein